jgi:hypothetical protein
MKKKVLFLKASEDIKRKDFIRGNNTKKPANGWQAQTSFI